MACCSWRPAFISASPVRHVGGPVMLATTVAPPQGSFDMNSQANWNLGVGMLNSEHVSRRKTMLYLSAGVLGGLAHLSAEPAEARSGRRENRRKAMEKLREKARESGPRREKQRKRNEQSPPQSLEEQAIGPLVEASFL